LSGHTPGLITLQLLTRTDGAGRRRLRESQVSDLRFELGRNSWSGRKRPSPVRISTATPDQLDEWFHHATDDTPPCFSGGLNAAAAPAVNVTLGSKLVTRRGCF